MKWKLLLLIPLSWTGYYFWKHPEDISHPLRIIPATRTLAEDAADPLLSLLPLRAETQPPGIWAPEYPAMYAVNASSWRFRDYTFTPLYGYHLHARVLGKAHYIADRESELAPYDMALGWQDMSDSRTLAQISISQSNRWYYYRYAGAPPIAEASIPLESGNMHIIPANEEILHTLRKITTGNIIELAGYLVEIQGPDGWHWRSGTSNTGEGQGSCKVIWVTLLRIER